MFRDEVKVDEKASYVVWLEPSLNRPSIRSLIGNKATGILELLGLEHLGFKVPKGFVVTTQTYNKIFSLQADSFNKLLHRNGSIEKTAKKIQEHFMYRRFGPYDFIRDHVAPAYQRLCEFYGAKNVGVAVRSSAIFEDLKTKSYAGSYESYLNIKGLNSLVDHILLCFAAAWKKHLLMSYKKDKVAEEVSIALLIQQTVCSDVAGVAFTADPVSGDTSKICINSAWGLGETVVSGRVNADIFYIKKGSMQLENAHVGEKTIVSRCQSLGGTYSEPLPPEMVHTPSLTTDNVLRLARVCSRIEEEVGFPVDVEWAYLKDELFLLQVRPITTL